MLTAEQMCANQASISFMNVDSFGAYCNINTAIDGMVCIFSDNLYVHVTKTLHAQMYSESSSRHN